MISRLFLFFQFFILCFTLQGQVTVQFFNPTYKGDTIHITTEADYITGIDTIIAWGRVDEIGNFSCTFPLEVTSRLVLPLHFFNGVLYAEPGKTYVLTLPKKTAIPVHAEISPFFEPMPFFACIGDSGQRDLNTLIYEFDSIYDDYVTKNASVLLFEAYRSKVDTFITALENRFGKTKIPYFETYMSSKIAMLHYISKKRDLYYVINHYLNAMPVSVHNDGYMHLFNNLFDDFFRVYSLRKEGSTLFDDIAKAKSPHAIRKTLSMNPVFVNDTISELIILKGIHDAFFPGDENMKRDFPHPQLYMTLDSVRLVNRYVFSRDIALRIMEKARNRYKPITLDGIVLSDCSGNAVELQSYKGKYTYMAFYDMRNYTCQRELKQLTKMATKHSADLQFVLIIVNPDKKDFGSFCAKNQFTFPVLYASSRSEIYTKYELKAYPHYMLFDSAGFARMSSAPSPSENFESQLFRSLE